MIGKSIFRCWNECLRREEVSVSANDWCRVNMYASTWICTKEVGIEQEDGKAQLRQASLVDLKLEAPAMRVD